MKFTWLWRYREERNNKAAAYDALSKSKQQRAEQAAKRVDAERQAERFIDIRDRNHFAEAIDRALRERR